MVVERLPGHVEPQTLHVSVRSLERGVIAGRCQKPRV